MKRLACMCAIGLLLALGTPAHADIFQWEYINPADPSQGKRQSATLAPDGAGVDAVPGANLESLNLTMAYLVGADLTDAYGYRANLTNADLSQANLSNADFTGATLIDADFADADVRAAHFSIDTVYGHGTGISLAQLYSTASYQARELIGIYFYYNNLAGGNFSSQNLTNARLNYVTLMDANFRQANLTNVEFYGATLDGVSFEDAEVRGASFTGLTAAQLYSTASYKSHDLTGVGLSGNDLRDWNFAGQNLTNANFLDAVLAGADFTDAEVHGAIIPRISLTQLYSTASYQARDLTGTSFGIGRFPIANFAGGNFAGLKLTNASFSGATITDANFADADVRGTDFGKTIYQCGGVAVCFPAAAGRRFGSGITLSQLYSTASYQDHDLSGIGLSLNDLAGGNFADQNLANASFDRATLTNADFHEANLANAQFYYATLTAADFTGAEIRGATFYIDRLQGTGITLAQLYSTASYEAHDLSFIGLQGNNLAGANFAGQNLTNAGFSGATLAEANFREANLTNAYFHSATLTDADFNGANLTNAAFWIATLTEADFTGADTRGAMGLNLPDSGASSNLIRPDGHITGLDLDGGGLLVVRDYNGDPRYAWPAILITVDQHLAMGPGGMLRMVFEADAWDSTISFVPGIPVALGGTLELTFANDVNLVTQLGRTFDLFDWTGVDPTGAFTVSSPYRWDLSNLYTTGEVTLTAVPEPSAIALATAALGVVMLRRAWYLRKD